MKTHGTRTIEPFHTSGVQPAVSGAVGPAGAPTRRVPIENHTTPGQRRTLARHFGSLIEPRLTGDVVVVRIDGHRHGLPGGVELAPGDGVVYAMFKGAVFVFVASAEGIRQLDIDRGLADRIRSTHFTK